MTILEKGITDDLAAHFAGPASVKRVMLAEVLLHLGQKAAAMAAADEAAVGASDEDLLYPAAIAYLDGGYPAKALALAGKLTARFEPDPQAYGKLIQGEARLRRGESREAIRIFEEARKLADTWLGRFSLGRAYLEAGS